MKIDARRSLQLLSLACAIAVIAGQSHGNSAPPSASPPMETRFWDARAGLSMDDGSGVERKSGQFVSRSGPTPPSDRLPPNILTSALRAYANADQHRRRGEWRKAVELLSGALDEMPEPLTRWNASTFLLVAIGDTLFRQGEYETAARAFDDVMWCPGAIGNPFVHLRNGQTQYELGKMDRAADELARAYLGGTRTIFEGEHARYFALVEKVLKPPPGKKTLE